MSTIVLLRHRIGLRDSSPDVRIFGERGMGVSNAALVFSRGTGATAAHMSDASGSLGVPGQPLPRQSGGIGLACILAPFVSF
ncbi:MAG: hypothetical protein QM674_07420 [Burkholderiaceae bacterium]